MAEEGNKAESLGWGILGTGALVDLFVAPAIADHPDNHVAAVFSRDLHRAGAFTARHGGTPFDSYDAMLADPGVEAVYVATPNSLHAAQAIDAAAAGKHVFVEKPMALSADDGRAIVAAADDAGVLLGVGFHLRHKTGTKAAREAIVEGRLGRVFFVEVDVGGDKSLYPYDTWRSEPAMVGGGTAINQGVHATDLVRYLTGSEIVTMAGTLSQPPPEDVFAAVCTAADGTMATLVTHHMLRGTRPDFAVFGDKGWILASRGTVPMPGESVVLHDGDGEHELETSDHMAYWHEVGDFSDSIRNGTPFSGDGHDGVYGILAADSIYESARSNRTVDVGDAF